MRDSPSKPHDRPRSLALRSVDRSIERRRAAYEAEVDCLVAASFEVIRKTGNLEPRVGEIVAEAGLSNQAFYRHFRSKDELLLAVLDEGARMLQTYIAHRMEKVSSPEQKIRSWIGGVLAQALDPDSARATRPFAASRARLAELFPEEVAESEGQLRALLRDAIEDAVASGDMPGADPERDAQIIYNLAIGWMERKIGDPTSPQREDAEHLIEFAIHGLRRSTATLDTTPGS